MKINLIIGAGQLGSRHLQGLLKYPEQQKIYVVDPFSSSLETARQRAEEVKHQNEITYLSGWDELPEFFDMVIVATNAGVRAAIIKDLLNKYTVKYLVLEKVLFQKLEDYEEVRSLLKSKTTLTWVNHPRRMHDHFKNIRQKILETDSKVTLHTYGINWGMACNAIHLIDLVSFITDSVVSTVDTDWVDNVLHESKRAGHIELTGTLKVLLENGSQCMITSSAGGQSALLTTYISAGASRWIIAEGAGSQVISFDQNNKAQINDYTPKYQSELTSKLADQLFENGNCDLPTYEEAYKAHVPYIKALLKKYNILSGTQSDTCPIT